MRPDCIFALVLFSQTAFASVYIDTEEIGVMGALGSDIREDLALDIAAGYYDRFGIEMPIAVRGNIEKLPPEAVTGEHGGWYLKVNAGTFGQLPARVKDQVTERLVTSTYDKARAPIYRASVDVEANRGELARNPLLGMIGSYRAQMPARVDASALLSDYASTWAYHQSRSDGPNCWHTAIAATSSTFYEARYMSSAEFLCHLRSTYRQVAVSDLADLRFGDVVRLADYSGEVHGFVYLGPDSYHPSQHIVFTKNGYRRGYYLFQTYDAVVNYLYPDTWPTFHRPQRTAQDPSVDASSPCLDEYQLQAAEERKGDAIILAGLRALNPRALEPIEID